MIGTTLGHYRILRKIGERGGDVYLARDERLERDVALKFLPLDPPVDEIQQARIRSEARAASALEHPNVAAIYEVDEADGKTFVSMEYVEGTPLSEMIGEYGLPVVDVTRYGTQIADALAHAHEHGVAHRDLKTSNVMITPDSNAKVLDFGLPPLLAGPALLEVIKSKNPLQKGPVASTLPYMAPETLRGNPPDSRSDLWALGVLLYEMITGKLPFHGPTAYEMSSSILDETAAPLPEQTPEGLRAVIERSLTKVPKRRYPWAIEVLAALRGGRG
jgi:eukaryotic-like serine/threonine-protein kinase